MTSNQHPLARQDVVMSSANRQHSTPENTYTIDHHRHRKGDKDQHSPPPRRHSHHAPVCKFDAEKWKTEFRRKSIDSLPHEQRFIAAQQRRGLNVMDTTDEDREYEEARQRIADDGLQREYDRYLSIMEQHRYMTDLYMQQQSVSQPAQQSYTDPVMMERTQSTAFNGRLSSSP
ncbi:hypothetical protein K450DRAFT_259347 [Umbelopsis ramanniana AG]|uniref:Uncharacterized protein n=1 Tax=Umbelopsis ramanniana AG TaxID=1314678 RepID=A0AAD5HAM7_UMBRA|nr:uncharacterized protein K450DRAFT_259347 [Umbelopsis ramanniana AG]KAI8575909.1 hypothetical protein K450DRAFT_259347 [Umbelopsis ramanniana AG]